MTISFDQISCADGALLRCAPAHALLTPRACGCLRAQASGALLELSESTAAAMPMPLSKLSEQDLRCLTLCSQCEYTQHWTLWPVFYSALKTEMLQLMQDLESIDWDRHDPEKQRQVKKARYKRRWQVVKARKQRELKELKGEQNEQ